MRATSFQEVLNRYTKASVLDAANQVTSVEVERVLRAARLQQPLTPEQFVSLISAAAEPYLEEMAHLAHERTLQRFGRTILMYVPLYLSNECLCQCTYCGFSFNNDIKRYTLNQQELLQEAGHLHQLGFRHILLLSGEDARYVNPQSLAEAAQSIRHLFSSISVEVQPLKTEEYRMLVENGIEGVTVYQETYDPEVYPKVHIRGKKRRYSYRLQTPERAAQAGMRRLGIGALLGLSDWRYDAFCVGLHAHFLERKYWRTHVSISLPRLRQAVGKADDFTPVSDRHFVQLLTAYRLFLPNAGLVLSTREEAEFRDHVFPLGVTQMSAGSNTAPGGYVSNCGSGEQFEIEDTRTPKQVADMIESRGYEPVWKDWESELSRHWAGPLSDLQVG